MQLIYIIFFLTIITLTGKKLDAQCDSSTKQLIISTGYNHGSGTLLNDFALDPMWTLIQAPPDPAGWKSNIGGPAVVIPKSNAWQYAGNTSKYLSAYPTNKALTDNWARSTVPYIYERNFCLCNNAPKKFTTQLRIKLSLNADNWAEVKIEDAFGTLTPILSQKYIYDVINFSGLPDTIDTVLTLPIGEYKIKLYQRNRFTDMGVNLDGFIESRGISFDNECISTGTVAGFLYEDKNLNGFYDKADIIAYNQVVSLYDENRVFIKSIKTDKSGYYFFMNQIPGTYHVKLGENSAWNTTPPYNDVITIKVNKNKISRADFLSTKYLLEIENKTINTLNINVYPNPSNGLIEFSINNTDVSLQSVNINNLIGETVLSIENISETGSIDLSFLPPGIYNIHFILEQGTIMKRISLL